MNELMTFEHIMKSYQMGRAHAVKAVSDFSLTVYEGETLGLVGESGCGKSTVAKIACGISEPDSGVFRYKGELLNLKGYKSRRAYAKQVQILFQDPFASLDPHMTVDLQIMENMMIQKLYSPAGRKERVVELLELVGLSKSCVGRFPHEFSGGQLQRICIARALAGEPQVLICDEPVSSLDVSIQGQIINLLKRLQEQMGLTYIFISHDLNLVKHLSSRIAVMYKGTIVELAAPSQLFESPQHPYTKKLLESIPRFRFAT